VLWSSWWAQGWAAQDRGALLAARWGHRVVAVWEGSTSLTGGGVLFEVGVVSVAAGAWVFGDLRLTTVPETRPFRVPCMTPDAYGSVFHRPYRRPRHCCWYHAVDWREATTMASDVLRWALTHLAARDAPRAALSAVVDQHLPRSCPQHLKEAVEGLAWRHPITVSTGTITDGVHRLTAMRH
jgi:hypothetical protein